MKKPKPTVGRIWECKIGDARPLVPAADVPMREAVRLAYMIVTGRAPRFFFSGWGGELTATEKSVIGRRRAAPLDKKSALRWRRVRAALVNK